MGELYGMYCQYYIESMLCYNETCKPIEHKNILPV